MREYLFRLPRLLALGVLHLLVFGAFVAAAATATAVYAEEARGCYDYVCGDNDANCTQNDCDVCHSDFRCALVIP